MSNDLILKLGTFSTSVPTRAVPIRWIAIIGLPLIFIILVKMTVREYHEDEYKQEMIGMAFFTTFVVFIMVSYYFGGILLSNKTFREVTAEVNMNNPKVQVFFQDKDDLLEAERHVKFDLLGRKLFQSDGKVYFSKMMCIRDLKDFVPNDKKSAETFVGKDAVDYLKKVYDKSGKSTADLVFDKK